MMQTYHCQYIPHWVSRLGGQGADAARIPRQTPLLPPAMPRALLTDKAQKTAGVDIVASDGHRGKDWQDTGQDDGSKGREAGLSVASCQYVGRVNDGRGTASQEQ